MRELPKGRPLSELVEELGISRQRAYDIAARYNLPTNNLPAIGGKTELRMLAAFAGGATVKDLGKQFRMAESMVRHVLRRCDVDPDR